MSVFFSGEGIKLHYGFQEKIMRYIKKNFNTFFSLFMAFVIGVSAGAFTSNGLSSTQKEELVYYFQGFLHLLDNQKVDTGELLKIATIENIKIVFVIWILGVTIIGAPFIFIIVGIKGFITGFSSGFIIKILGLKGVLFTIFALLPKEFIIVPCIITLGVSGINFSRSILKSNPAKHFSKENIKANFAAYCIVTLFFTCLIFAGALVEAYITPVFIRIISPMIIA